jgi:hypothetical protein
MVSGAGAQVCVCAVSPRPPGPGREFDFSIEDPGAKARHKGRQLPECNCRSAFPFSDLRIRCATDWRRVGARRAIAPFQNQSPHDRAPDVDARGCGPVFQHRNIPTRDGGPAAPKRAPFKARLLTCIVRIHTPPNSPAIPPLYASHRAAISKNPASKVGSLPHLPLRKKIRSFDGWSGIISAIRPLQKQSPGNGRFQPRKATSGGFGGTAFPPGFSRGARPPSQPRLPRPPPPRRPARSCLKSSCKSAPPPWPRSQATRFSRPARPCRNLPHRPDPPTNPKGRAHERDLSACSLQPFAFAKLPLWRSHLPQARFRGISLPALRPTRPDPGFRGHANPFQASCSNSWSAAACRRFFTSLAPSRGQSANGG